MRRFPLASLAVLAVCAVAACGDDPSALDELDPSTFTAEIRGDRTLDLAGTAVFGHLEGTWQANLFTDDGDYLLIALLNGRPAPGLVTLDPDSPLRAFAAAELDGESFSPMDGRLEIVSSTPTAVAGHLRGTFVGQAETAAAGDTIQVTASFRSTGAPPEAES